MTIRIGFEKFKNKIYADILVKSVLFGAAFAFALVGGLLLGLKLSGVELFPLWYVLIGVGAFLLVTAGLFFLLRPNDRGVAKKLDKDLHLGEKAQTMIEFADRDGAIVRMQRENAEETLQSKAASLLKGVPFWYYLILPVLTLALLLTAVFVPAKAEENPPYEPPATDVFVLSQWQETALGNLITYVDESKLNAAVREPIVENLQALLATLKETTKESVMKTEVVSSIRYIDGEIARLNTEKEVALTLETSMDGQIKKLAIVIGTLNEDTLDGVMLGIAETCKTAEYATVIPAFTAELNAVIRDATVADGEAFVTKLTAFSAALNAAAAVTDETERNAAIDQTITTSMEDIRGEITKQKINRDVKDYAVTQLISIFRLSGADLPILESEYQPPQDSVGGEEEDGNKGNGGGLGEGETIFGSNDLIFDPDDNTHKSYGDDELLFEYYARYTQLRADGKISEEMQKILDAYFTALFDGTQNQEN